MFIKLAIGLMALLLFCKEVIGQTLYGVSGPNVMIMVYDSANGQPLSGAAIRLKNGAALGQTDKNGVATLAQHRFLGGLEICYLGYSSRLVSLPKSAPAGPDTLRIGLRVGVFEAEAVIVSATRGLANNGFAYANLTKAEISKQNLGQDLPVLLAGLPSVVSWSDAGAGVGYTGFRVRGSDPSRTNVTINGIPVNDSESQNVFWVNMPDLASSVDNIQLQRGVGSSTHGAGAFGATLNIQTSGLETKPSATTDHSFGSFNTRKHNVRMQTGLLKNGFAFDVRLSKIASDGYIRPGFSDLKSFFASGAWYGKKSMAKLLVFSGNERTYQAWNGVPISRYQNDVPAMKAYISRNGLSDPQAQRLLNSGRNYNVFDYPNQTDNYRQDHYQLHFSHAFSTNTNVNLALHYTGGGGYYEEFKENQAFGSYNLDTLRLANQLISQTDLVRRRHLKNHFYGANFSLNHSKNNWNYTFGMAANGYQGLHYGDIIWARFASQSAIGHRFYQDDALKNELSIFGKINYNYNNSNVFLDLQGRGMQYQFVGITRLARIENRSVNLYFFNPKAGYTRQITNNILFYGSVAVAHREPNRDDFTENPKEQTPKPERLIDYETGLKYNSEKVVLAANAFFMDYYNQLVLTGRINDVGNAMRTNVARSYRTGLELEMAFLLHSKLKLAGNLTLSQNKILAFSQFSDSYDADFNYLGQQERKLENTNIALSPDLVGAARLVYLPIKQIEISWQHKYVGRQYLDNSQDKSRSLEAFWVNDLHVYCPFTLFGRADVSASLQVNNVFDVSYAPNGYTYDYLVNNEKIVENFVFPQAGRHFMMGMSLKF